MNTKDSKPGALPPPCGPSAGAGDEGARRVYFNRMQLEVTLTGARDSIVVAGRGTGKGLLHAAVNLRNFQAMPGSTTAIVAPNAIRAKTNTIPSMTMHWEAWGYRRGVHWEIGRRPPRSLGWPAPLVEPYSWDNVLSFYTGAVAQIISQDRAGTSNSKSFDFIDIDEAKFIDFEQLKSETFQANRGQEREFGRCPWHHGMLVTSDMPLGRRGSWFMRYRDLATPELCDLIGALEAERAAQLKAAALGARDATAVRRRTDSISATLRELRRHALLFRTYSSLTNMEVLGEEFIRRQKRDLPPLIFQTSILCLPVRALKDGFYSSLAERHLYTAAALPWLDRQEWAPRPAAPDCRADADILPGGPLAVAFDFNRNINWLVCGQADEARGRMNTLKSFYVKYERKLPDLIADFCRHYEPLERKDVIFYYDSTALGSNYAVNDQDFRWVVEHELARRRWRVTPVYIGHPMNHAEKHLLVNRAFDGHNRLTPYFNEPNNADLLVSLRTAGIYNGKKDKRGEKLAETEEDRLEARTDGSDAWDTLYIGLERFPAAALPLSSSSNWG